MSVYGNFYEQANPAPVADAWCVYEIDSSGSGDTDQNPKILDGYGISKVERIQSGVHRVYFTNPEKVASGGYVVMCGSELGNAPSSYTAVVVHGTTASSASNASGASGSFDLSILGFNAGNSSAPSTLADFSYTVRNRVNLAVFCLRSDAELGKTRVQNLVPSVLQTNTTNLSGSGGIWGTAKASYGGTEVSLVPNTKTAPDGTLTATTVKVSGNSGGQKWIQYSIPTNAGKVFTRSVYVKSARSGFNLKIIDNGMNSGSTPVLIFNPTTGATTGSGSIPGHTNYRAHNVKNVGNGWWRVSLSMIGDLDDGSVNFYMAPVNGTDELGWAGDGGDYLYLWGAQLEEGLVATPLINSPIPPTNGNQDLLLRPAASGNGFGQMTYQNLLTNTETTGSWSKNRVGISAGYTAPDGTTTAFKIWEYQTPSGEPNYKNAYLGGNIANFGHTAGGHRPTTFSFYAKADERRYVRVVDGNSGNYGIFVVDLLNGRVVQNTAALHADVHSAGDGWWRISVTAPRRAGLVSNRYVNVSGIAPSVDPNDTSIPGATDVYNQYGAVHAGVSGSGILVWHGQVNHGTVYGDYARSGAAIVGTTFSRVLGATYESVARVLPSGGAATAWGTIVVPTNKGNSSPVTAYLENSYGVGSVSASSNNTFTVTFSESMSTDSYCVVTSIETETVYLPESGVGTAGSIPPTDEFVLPIMRTFGSESADAQRKRSGFILRCLRQDPVSNIFTEQSAHHQRGREFKIHFMVFGGKLIYGAG